MRIAVMVVAAVVVTSSFSMASQRNDPFDGTWILDAPASDFGAGIVLRQSTLRIRASAERVDVIVDAVAQDGRVLHIVYGGPFDGTPQRATGSPTFDAVGLRRPSVEEIERTDWKAGVMVSAQVARVSGDRLTTAGYSPATGRAVPLSAIVYTRRGGNLRFVSVHAYHAPPDPHR